MKTKKQIIAKRKRLITKFNKTYLKSDKKEDIMHENLVLGQLISLNWVLNEK